MSEHLHLDKQLCFVIYATSREMTRLYRPLLDELGLTYPQYLVLLVLWEMQEATVKELGDRLYLDSGTLTPLLKRLETNDLILRTRSQEDERKVVIRLTEKGQALKERASQVPQQLMCKSQMEVEEYVELKTEFERLLEKLHEINGK